MAKLREVLRLSETMDMVDRGKNTESEILFLTVDQLIQMFPLLQFEAISLQTIKNVDQSDLMKAATVLNELASRLAISQK